MIDLGEPADAQNRSAAWISGWNSAIQRKMYRSQMMRK
jgi:hypothetical protein